MINKISGKRSPAGVKHLQVGDKEIAAVADIADTHNMETYNSPFSIEELLDALSSSHNSAVGLDDIHYQMLKHLPSGVLNTLLSILNDIWLTGNFPSSWRQSYVVSIPKPGKDTSDPTNYRPIVLTSCVCKVMECMVNNRFVWYLERNKIITPIQSG